MTVYSLAHVSDLHLGPMPPLLLRDWNVKRGLGVLNWHRKRKRLHAPEAWATILADMKAARPDHIALTGDLVNVGLPAEHAAAAHWLADLGAPDDVTVVPGNHDIYTRLSGDPGIERWRPWMTGDDGTVGPVAGFPFARRRGPLLVIGMNSAEPTAPFVASGRVGSRQIDVVAEMLAEAGAEGLCRTVLIHHPPLPGQTKAGRDLRDAREFATMLADVGVEIVLHGHNHRDMVTTLETKVGTALISGIASGSMAAGGRGEPARYAVHAISRTNAGWHVESVLRGLDSAGGIGELGRAAIQLVRA